MEYEINEAIAKKVFETVEVGLCKGMGKPVAGQMCVEAAVCFALGLPHSDEPPCVGSAVRSYKITLNDAAWSSNSCRAKGMKLVSVAQLGSDQIDQKQFSNEVALGVINRIVPIALRSAASLIPSHKDALEAAAVGCEIAIDLVTARAAANAAYAAANAARAARAAANAAYAAANAARAARAAANAAYAAANAAYAADAAAYAAEAAAYAADAAAYAAAKDNVLSIAAQIAVDALKKLGSKGCEWLYLAEEPKS